MNPKTKTFLIGRERLTGQQALEKYPDPKFFMRPRPSLTVDECREILRRNCDEAAMLVEMLRSNGAFKKKAPIIETANRLHDFRISLFITSGEFGRPYLWEE